MMKPIQTSIILGLGRMFLLAIHVPRFR